MLAATISVSLIFSPKNPRNLSASWHEYPPLSIRQFFSKCLMSKWAVPPSPHHYSRAVKLQILVSLVLGKLALLLSSVEVGAAHIKEEESFGQLAEYWLHGRPLYTARITYTGEIEKERHTLSMFVFVFFVRWCSDYAFNFDQIVFVSFYRFIFFQIIF